TWEQRQVLPFGDRPSISVDRTDGQARDTLYILQSTDVRLDDDGGKRGEPMTSEVYSSRDGGRTFSGSSNLHYERKIRNGPYYLYRSHAAIAADGTATYISPLDCRSNNYGKDCFRKPGLLSYANRPGLSREFELRSDTVLNPPAR